MLKKRWVGIGPLSALVLTSFIPTVSFGDLPPFPAPLGISKEFIPQSFEAQFKVPAIPDFGGLKSLPDSALSCTDSPLRTIQGPHGESELRRCLISTDHTEAGKPARMNIVSLNGTLAESAYAQGYLLAEEIETGGLTEALANIDEAFAEMKPIARAAAEGVLSCYQKKIEATLDDEFKFATDELYRGYAAGIRARTGHEPQFTLKQIRTATYSIEIGNIFTAREYDAKYHKFSATTQLLGDCIKPIAGHVIQEIAAGLWKKITHLGKKRSSKDTLALNSKIQLDAKFACTGIVVPKSLSADGFLYHGRNLEQTAAIRTWNQDQSTYIIHEPGKDSKGRPYARFVAFGTAGMIFPGGISGYNEFGISASLHQLDPTKYTVNFPDGSAAMGPYMQQRVLREAHTIDEAIEIVSKLNNYAEWTMLVSDAHTQRVVSIEISKHGSIVSRDKTDEGVGQANYNFSPKDQKWAFNFSYNFYLEGISRVNWVDHVLKNVKMDLGKLIGLMGSHMDWFEGETSFGRGISRVMNIMSTIVSPLQNRIWVTVGDRMPAVQGYYLSFDVDFAKMRLYPQGAVKTTDYDSTPHWEESFSIYQTAFKHHVAGREIEARKGVEAALAEAQKDGKDDRNYHYIIAKFLLNEGDFAGAYTHLQAVERGLSEMHPIKRANLRLLQIYALDRLPTGDARLSDAVQRDRWKDEAETVYRYVLTGNKESHYFPLAAGGYLPTQEDLKAKLKLLGQIYAKSAKIKLPKIDMKTAD